MALSTAEQLSTAAGRRGAIPGVSRLFLGKPWENMGKPRENMGKLRLPQEFYGKF
jgi:hypothetical protein